MFRIRLIEKAGRLSWTRQWMGLTLLGLMAAGCGRETIVDAPPAQVVFENDLFRILDMNLPPGTTLEHASARDVAMVSMSEGARTRMESGGEGWSEAASQPLGSVTIGGMPGTHRVQNVGEGAHQIFAIESLQSGDPSGDAPLSGRGVTLAAESPALRAYDVRLGEETFQVSHVHAVPAVAVLVTGRIISQGAEIESGDGSEAPTGVKQLDQPGQWVFAPPGESHYVVRLGTEDVHVVEIEIR
jgi:hypothetical protein